MPSSLAAALRRLDPPVLARATGDAVLVDARSLPEEDLPLLEQGETIILCKRNVPIAEIRPIEKRRTKPQELGFMKGLFEVTDAFFEPLAEDILAAFEGREHGEE